MESYDREQICVGLVLFNFYGSLMLPIQTQVRNILLYRIHIKITVRVGTNIMVHFIIT